MARERDVRNAIVAALEATTFFDAIYTTGLPDASDQSAEDCKVAAIYAMGTKERDDFDGPTAGVLQYDAKLRIVFAVRDTDEQARDDAVEDLLAAAQNALNGQSLAEFTMPEWTKFTDWTWENPTPPERRITAIFMYRYLVMGWNNFDTTA